MDGLKTSFLLGWPIFRGYVSFMGCITPCPWGNLHCNRVLVTLVEMWDHRGNLQWHQAWWQGWDRHQAWWILPSLKLTYCWWLKSGVHQLRLVVCPIICRVFTCQVVQDFFHQQFAPARLRHPKRKLPTIHFQMLCLLVSGRVWFLLGLHPRSLTWFTWKWPPGDPEIPALETIVFRFYVKLFGIILPSYRIIS